MESATACHVPTQPTRTAAATTPELEVGFQPRTGYELKGAFASAESTIWRRPSTVLEPETLEIYYYNGPLSLLLGQIHSTWGQEFRSYFSRADPVAER